VFTSWLSQEQANSLSTLLKDGLQGAILHRHEELEVIRLELKQSMFDARKQKRIS
jgi:hypothetical protein